MYQISKIAIVKFRQRNHQGAAGDLEITKAEFSPEWV